MPAPSGAASRFDGWYRGRRIPVGPAASCREAAREVWFRVENGSVELRGSRHHRSAVKEALLTGTVSPGGELALVSDLATRFATGRIEGDSLVAADAAVPAVSREGGANSSCLRRYEAVRQEPIRP
ncbi:hypothetical protein [Muricoccus pecuniae]|uniref:Uncharacterized protein n=1 Tax=Muricoccus pecuniae TaxID=693023 RepID=A0A840Y025_9PROT|nr:hypothetical protein [Roseomonas pecuniae]MBB5694065.1 hypothetical protein [Roseomonas pecuniae]